MSQLTKILKHLRKKPITAIEALNSYGCFRLAARISDLREKGYTIEKTMVERSGKRFAKYRLVA